MNLRELAHDEQRMLMTRARAHFESEIARRIVDHELGIEPYADSERQEDEALIAGIDADLAEIEGRE